MTTKTYRLSGKRIERAWHVIDAGGRPLGRVASEVANLLMGKHKPDFEPHLPMGDHVIVINARAVELTGRKADQKVYFRHTGYPGGLRERSYRDQLDRDPRRVIERAVRGMLPHNARGRELFRHLRVYAGAEHPHEAQVKAGTGARARKRASQATAAPATSPSAQEAARAEEEARASAAVEETPPVPAAPSPAAPPETPTPAAAEAAAAAGEAEEAARRLSGSLNRYRREELDEEAKRLGIEIESDWKKPDVIAAIEQHYEAHPLEGEE